MTAGDGRVAVLDDRYANVPGVTKRRGGWEQAFLCHFSYFGSCLAQAFEIDLEFFIFMIWVT